MSLQALVLDARYLLSQIAAPALLFGYTLIVWLIARTVSRYKEQRRIRDHLDEITRTELAGRDKRIADLEAEHGVLREAFKVMLAERRAVRKRLAGLGDLLDGGTPEVREALTLVRKVP